MASERRRLDIAARIIALIGLAVCVVLVVAILWARAWVDERVDGTFDRGDAVIIRDLDGAEIGRGLVAYDAADAAKVIGLSTADVKNILGFEGRAEIVHRDDLVMGGG